MAGRIAPIYRASLEMQDDFPGWRDAVRAFIAAQIPPEQIIWQVAGDEIADLFGGDPTALPSASAQADIRMPRAFFTTLRIALLHNAPTRFALAYRLLWRMRQEPLLSQDPADPDMIAIQLLAKSVRRDIHKMHAFVRFRKVGEVDGREQFAAWFEPDHHITRAVAGFFRDRFTAMDWLIVTPRASISWDGIALREGPGGTAADVPGDDAVEDEWRAYYGSIFNPARLKVNAMKREMPVRYWRNLPETSLIPSLIENAARRLDAMVSEKAEQDLFGSERLQATGRANYERLEALYAALCEEDVAPSPDFSDRIVLGEGPEDAPLMFVGEQPGEQEDLSGNPFVGPAGQLLNQCLEEAGIERDRAFLTNAVKRFKFTLRGKKRIHQTPTAGDIAHYRWWLAEEVRLVNPRVIIALGATALYALSGRKQALGPLRGTIAPWDGRQLLVTVHPSFLLRLPDQQARDIERGKFIRELARARLHVESS